LIWGDDQGNLQLPKKYYAYRHFTHASTKDVSTPLHLRRCDEWSTAKGVLCVSFGDKNAVFVNARDALRPYIDMKGSKCSELCCTTSSQDYSCSDQMNWIPPGSVCSCLNIVPSGQSEYDGSTAGKNSFIKELVGIALIYLALL